jgi:uncharacterized protein (DUF885 family)
MSKFPVLTILCALIFPLLASAQPSDVESRRKALNDLLAEQWEYTMRTSPIYASILGDKRWNDKLDDFSQQAIDDDLRENQKFLVRFEAIDTAGFPEQEVLNKKLMVRDLKMKLDEARFKPWEMPVAQNRGVHLDMPQLVNMLSFESAKDYEDYIARLRQLPVLFDQNVVQMRKGMAEGLMPPRFLLEKVVVQANGIGTQPPEKSPFAQPFEKFPKAISEADQRRLREQGLAAIRDAVLPAYVKFAKFVGDEYAPKGRTEVGIWSLPDGDARYAFRVKDSTTTDLTPEEIHQIGLAQVKEIEGRMLAVANRFGYKDEEFQRCHCQRSQVSRALAPGDPRPLPEIYRPDVSQTTRALRPAAQSEAGDHGGGGVPRERSIGGVVRARHARRFTSRPRDGQHWRLRSAQSTQH